MNMNTQSQHNYPRKPGREQGFSMFELLVYILVASILFSVAMNRYQDYPAAAERANFMAVLAQLKAGVNLQMMRIIAGGSWASETGLEGSNPMNLMLEVPTNYLGEFSEVDPSRLPRRVWYFDSTAGHLVYIADNAPNLYLLIDGQQVEGNEVRFRIQSVYSTDGVVPVVEEAEDNASGEQAEIQPPSSRETRLRWQGFTLSPVIPYEWRSVPLELVADN